MQNVTDTEIPTNEANPLGRFGRYLSLWVGLCIAGGVGLGRPMTAKKVAALVLGAFVATSLVVLVVKGVRRQEPVKAEPPRSEAEAAMKTTLVVYYLHGNFRCATCQKLEAYTSESLQRSFADEIRSGAIDFRVVNFDEPENDHLRNKYDLHSQSVVLSMETGGTESRWKNLDRIWKLVRDKEAFLAYIRDEVRSFRDAS